MEVPEIFKPLPYKELRPDLKDYQKRVLFFDTIELYPKIADRINHYVRLQSIPVYIIFPSIKGYCSCGCGTKLTGRQTRWASENCQHFAVAVRDIICGYQKMIDSYLGNYHEYNCNKCSISSNDLYLYQNKGLEIDHIIPVVHGGGGCWLSNYQFLCGDCHITKTGTDFNWKKKIIVPEHPKLF